MFQLFGGLVLWWHKNFRHKITKTPNPTKNSSKKNILPLSKYKLCKTVWVQNNTENHPPRTHNLLKLLNEAKVSLSEDDQLFLVKLNKYQIEGRYPEDIENLYAITHKLLVTEYIKKIKQLQLWLRKQLQ